ncbi:30S ribosomal protein S4 [Candidatus Bathyarchaeota archaeon ex4484_135]|nr:MAG: 30S ribosomal protein S4 [Candidatus Bathyarchaeota archaeon ex4484_135]
MGDPKRPRKKYKTPRHPWRADVLRAELEIMGTYGLRNKRELWRAKTMVSNFRRIARQLISQPPEVRKKREEELLSKLYRLGLLDKDAVLDNVLDLTVEDLLERRLQTIVWRKGLAKSPYQARQLIVHGHIAIGGRKVYSPGYLVRRDEEDLISYAPTSPFVNKRPPGLEEGGEGGGSS